jgi:hypothetical protein
MKKKLPIAKPVKHIELVVKPVQGASRPEFPTRGELYRKAGIIGGATLLASGLAGAQPAQQAGTPNAKPAIAAASLEGGSINGKALGTAAPKIKIYREGGGIGPAEDMWQVEDVEAFISWTMAKEGRLALQTKYKLDFDGTKITLDGFDPARNVGYTYVDPHDPQRTQYSADVRAKLDAWMKDRKLAILFIEVRRYPDAATLKGKVIKFLHAVQQQPPAPGKK